MRVSGHFDPENYAWRFGIVQNIWGYCKNFEQQWLVAFNWKGQKLWTENRLKVFL